MLTKLRAETKKGLTPEPITQRLNLSQPPDAPFHPYKWVEVTDGSSWAERVPSRQRPNTWSLRASKKPEPQGNPVPCQNGVFHYPVDSIPGIVSRVWDNVVLGRIVYYRYSK